MSTEGMESENCEEWALVNEWEWMSHIMASSGFKHLVCFTICIKCQDLGPYIFCCLIMSSLHQQHTPNISVQVRATLGWAHEGRNEKVNSSMPCPRCQAWQDVRPHQNIYLGSPANV